MDKLRLEHVAFFTWVVICAFGIFLADRSAVAGMNLKLFEVRAEGTGLTRQEAVSNALIDAIGQINGAEIAATTSSQIKEDIAVTGDVENYELSESFQSDVAKKTKGVVDSWTVISAVKDSVGLWDVALNARISKYKTSGQLKRLRMSVANFRLGQQTDQAAQFEKRFTRQLTDYLTQTRRFAMLDRKFMSEQNQELDFVANGGVATRELARLGNRVGTDYLIVGQVEQAQSTKTQHVMQTTGKKYTLTQTEARVAFRIIDVATSQIKFSDTYSFSDGQKKLTQVADQLADQAGEAILNAIFPIRIVAVSGNDLTLGQGGVTVQKGRSFKIIRQGKMLIDPYSKEKIGREETEIAVIEIVNVQSKTARAQIVSMREDVGEAFTKYALIARPVLSNADWTARQQGNAQQTMKQREQDIEQEFDVMEKEADDDW